MKERGYYRFKKGRGFTYQNERGRTIVSKSIKAWIDSLAIPPAWREVWISKDREAHLLATGYDQKERKQYIYNENWEEVREQKKISRMRSLSKALPRIRKAVQRDLRLKGLKRERVLAAVVSVIDETGARIGSQSYTNANDSHGVTTLRSKHVEDLESGALRYIGKSGKERSIQISDERTLEVIRQSEETSGYEIFKYVDVEGNKRVVTADETNEYIKRVANTGVTAKDFRTWLATVVALEHCVAQQASKNKSKQKLFTCVADVLGNTPAMAKDSYVLPFVIDLFEADKIDLTSIKSTKWMSQEEVYLRKLLTKYE